MSGSYEDTSTGRLSRQNWEADPQERPNVPEMVQPRFHDNDEPISVGYFVSRESKRRMWWRDAVINAIYIACWFVFATLLSMYNKWMFSPQYYGFPFPMFVTTMHMAVQFLLAFSIRTAWPNHFKPPGQPTVEEYIKKCMPCGISTGLDIGLSNLSLKTISLSLYTMCKSSSLIFVLTFAFIFRLERFSIRLVSVILLITAGVLMMVLSTDVAGHGPSPPVTDSDNPSLARRAIQASMLYSTLLVPRAIPARLKTPVAIGVFLVLSASACGGLRWALTQLLLRGAGHGHAGNRAQQQNDSLKKTMGLNHPAATIFYLTPTMFCTLFIIAFFLEGPFPRTLSQSGFFDTFGRGAQTTAYVLFPGGLAFSMVMSEYMIIQRTGIVPMSISGIFKEVTTILLSTWIFGDSMTLVNWLGLVVTFGGIIIFTHHKYESSVNAKSEEASDLRAGDEEEVARMLHGDDRAGSIALPPYSSIANRHVIGDEDSDEDDDENGDVLRLESRKSLLFDARDGDNPVPVSRHGHDPCTNGSARPDSRPPLPPLRLDISAAPSPFSALRRPPPEVGPASREMTSDSGVDSLPPRAGAVKDKDRRRVRFDIDEDQQEGPPKPPDTQTGNVLDL